MDTDTDMDSDTDTDSDSDMDMDTGRGRRLLVAAVCAISGLLVIGRTLADRSWADPEPRPSAPSSRAASLVVADLRRGGVGVTSRQQQAIRALLATWTARTDLKSSFPAVQGRPPLTSMLAWALATSDYGALGLSGRRGEYLAVQARMGISAQAAPGADVDVGPILIALAEQRTRPQFSVRPAMWKLIEVWRNRPDVRAEFSESGVVRARRYLQWSFTVPASDPAYAALLPVAASLERWYRDLPAAPEG